VHTNVPLKGTLSEGALAPLLGRLQRTGASGWLRVSSMTLRSGIPSVIRFGLRLHDGRVVAVEADEDPLRPSPADLAERATIGLTRILACRDAVQSWDPTTEIATPTTEIATHDPAAPLLAALALRAVDRVDAAVVEAALGDADRGLVAGASAEAGHALLTSSHRALLARVRPEVKAAELIRSGGEAAARELLALLCAGIVEWAPVETHAPPPPPQTDSPVARPATVAVSAKPAAPAPSAPAAPPSAPSGQMRREIEEAHAALRGANHFAVLGLTVSASEDEVRRAFARLARRYHPDAQRDPALQDVRQKLNDIFVAVGNAYAVLKDAAARDRYERAMGLRLAAPRVTVPAREAAAGPSAPAQRADEPIETRLLRAEEALDARQPWEAIRLLEETVSAAAGTLKVRAQVLLGRAYADRERPHEAEKVLLEVLQDDPVSVPACVLLGRIYRDRGMVKRARGMFERALEIEPGRVDAQRELLALGVDPAPPPPGGSSRSRVRDRH
jgi:tetratricopeptide (TPR) repeat protein